MRYVDGLSRHMRALVHEYGITIVAAMIDDGYTEPSELWMLLQGWRERRQEQWLATDYVTKEMAKRIAARIHVGGMGNDRTCQ